MEQTSRSHDIGKYILLVNKEYKDKARKWVDEELKRVHDAFAGNIPRLKDYPGPRRSLREDYTSVIGDYREVLLRQITPPRDYGKNSNGEGQQKQESSNKTPEQGKTAEGKDPEPKKGKGHIGKSEDGTIMQRLLQMEGKMKKKKCRLEEYYGQKS